MEGPVCHHKEHVEVDTHADVFTKNLHECGDCGAGWTVREIRSFQDVLIHGAVASPTN